MSAGSPVNLTPGLPETVLAPESAEVRHRVGQATAAGRDEAAAIVADHPRSLEAWAALGDAGRDPVERYAAYRVGYHRGLDALRANGWRGSGYVRWRHESNRAFLRCLDGLRRQAAVIGETDERDRCHTFLLQLDPAFPVDD